MNLNLMTLKEELEYAELCLPAHMLFLMSEEVKKRGYEFRADMQNYLNNASIAPLNKLAAHDIQRIATKVDNAAHSLMRELDLDTAQQALLAVAVFVINLVDKRVFPDPRNMAVLIAMTLLEEWKTDEGEWRGRMAEFEAFAQRLWLRAQVLGFYVKPSAIRLSA